MLYICFPKKTILILIILPVVLLAQLPPLSQWQYHNLTCSYKSGLADQHNLGGDVTSGITVFLSTEEISCSNSYFQDRGSWSDGTREIGGAWIIIEFPSKEIRDYDRGEFWAIMAYWVIGSGYGYDGGYLGGAGISAIDISDEKTVSGWVDFNVYNGSTAHGSFTVPLCLTSTNSVPFNKDLSVIYRFQLKDNFPNPFNSSTVIEFTLPKSDYVNLEVYNSVGQKIINLLSRHMSAGTHHIDFDASARASGVYFYKLSAGEFKDVKKMILLR